MKTHKRLGPIIPGTTDTMQNLTAPAQAGRVFLLANGGYGFECGCGYVLSARALGALQGAMTDHVSALASCPFAAARAKAEDEEDFSDL